MRATADRQRTKISATLGAEIVQRIQEYQREASLPSFSAALEELIWKQMMEEKARAYYMSMSAEEQAEQEAWARFSAEQFFKTTGEE